MTVSTASNCKISLGTTALGTDPASFALDTYTEVGEVEDLGEFGDEAQQIDWISLSDGRVRRFKGPRDAGLMPVTVGDDPADAGQLALITAEADNLERNVKVEFDDKLTGGGTNSIHYFHGLVMSKRVRIGQAANIVRRMFSIAVNSAVTEVAAT